MGIQIPEITAEVTAPRLTAEELKVFCIARAQEVLDLPDFAAKAYLRDTGKTTGPRNMHQIEVFVDANWGSNFYVLEVGKVNGELTYRLAHYAETTYERKPGSIAIATTATESIRPTYMYSVNSTTTQQLSPLWISRSGHCVAVSVG